MHGFFTHCIVGLKNDVDGAETEHWHEKGQGGNTSWNSKEKCLHSHQFKS